MENSRFSAVIMGACILLGLSSLGYLLGTAAIEFKEYERSVKVKGLSEQEYPADIVIWPIQFSAADNDLEGLYNSIEDSTSKIQRFLEKQGIKLSEITLSAPAIADKSARQYGKSEPAQFRYAAMQTVTVYSKNIDAV